eukprot:RCo017812
MTSSPSPSRASLGRSEFTPTPAQEPFHRETTELLLRTFFGSSGAEPRSDAPAEYWFPATLTPWQRRCVHAIAETMKLHHVSKGPDIQRCVVVSRGASETDAAGASDPAESNATPAAVTGSSSARNSFREYVAHAFGLPFAATNSPFFEFFAEWYDPLLKSKAVVEGVTRDLEACGGTPESVRAHLAGVKKQVITAVMATPAFEAFRDPTRVAAVLPLDKLCTFSHELRLNPYHPSCAGQVFLSFDLANANFNSLRFFDPELVLGSATYEEFVGRFSSSFWVRSSKHFRQCLFSELNPKGQTEVMQWLSRRVASVVVREGGVPAKQLRCLNRDEVVMQCAPKGWAAELSRLCAVLTDALPPGVGEFLRVEVFHVLHLEPHPYYVKEVYYNAFVSEVGKAPPVETSAILKVALKNVPVCHFAQVFDHYQRLRPQLCPYTVNRSSALYPKCLHITQFEGLLATFPDVVYPTNPGARPESPISDLQAFSDPSVVVETEVSEKVRRWFAAQYKLPIETFSSPCFEYLLDLLDPWLGSRMAFERVKEAIPVALRWKKIHSYLRKDVSPSLYQDLPWLQAQLPLLSAFLHCPENAAEQPLRLPLPPNFTAQDERRLRNLAEACLVVPQAVEEPSSSSSADLPPVLVCVRRQDSPREPPAGSEVEKALKDYTSHCLTEIREAVSAARLQGVLPEGLCEGSEGSGGFTVMESPVSVSAAGRPFAVAHVRQFAFHALRLFSEELVHHCSTFEEFLRTLAPQYARPVLFENPEVQDRLLEALPEPHRAFLSRKLLVAVATALCRHPLLKPSTVALNLKKGWVLFPLPPGVPYQQPSETLAPSEQGVSSASGADKFLAEVRLAMAEGLPAAVPAEEVVVDVFSPKLMGAHRWVFERRPHREGCFNLFLENVPAIILPQVLKAYLKQPVCGLDRVHFLNQTHLRVLEPIFREDGTRSPSPPTGEPRLGQVQISPL